LGGELIKIVLVLNFHFASSDKHSSNSTGQRAAGANTSRYSAGQWAAGADTARHSVGQGAAGAKTARHSRRRAGDSGAQD